jgi:hypothetical protein
MDYKIAILITTFLRDSLLEKAVKSVLINKPSNSIILIGDQNPNHIKELNYNYSPDCIYVPLPFDCGLSYARNELIGIANNFKCEYLVMSADSIIFNSPYDFTPYISLLESSLRVKKIGFGLKNRQPWEYNMELIEGQYFNLKKSTQYVGEYLKVDTCKNFFIATVKSFLQVPYDNDLKLCEHEDHCWRYKLEGYETLFTDKIEADYIQDRPEEYQKYRGRLYSEFKQKLLKKYGLKKWMIYK